jgi:hypothetical protein
MKKFGFVTVVTLSMELTGCIANSESVVITGMAPIDPASGCVASPTTTTVVTRGILDINLARGYWAAPILRNNLLSSQSSTSRVLDGRGFLLDGFRVRFRTTGLRVQLPERFYQLTGFVDSNQGKLAATFLLLSQAEVDLLRGDPSIPEGGRALVIANLKAEGRLTDGGNISSAEVAFPLDVCRGCLRSVPDPTACPTTEEPTEVCSAGQDFVVDCATYDRLRR